MPDQKISQLTDGGNAQAADEFVVARSGANYRIDGASVAAAATSVGTLTSLTVSGNTILGAEVFRGADNSFMRIAGGNPSSTGANIIAFGSTHATAPGRLVFAAVGTGAMQFSTGGAQRAEIDSSGNLAVDTNTLYVDAANNRVGVGTATPETTLHSVNFQGTKQLMLERTGSNSAKYAFTASANSLTIRDDAQSADRVTIDASGNLGLGVTPTYRMQVYSDNSTAYSSSDFDSARNLVLQNVNTTTNANIGLQFVIGGTSEAAITGIRTAAGETALAFGTRGSGSRSEKMRLDASGNLGIGTTSPGSRLHVNTGTNENLRVATDSGAVRVAALNDAASATITMKLQGSPLVFLGTGGSETARIHASGGFSLGTTTDPGAGVFLANTAVRAPRLSTTTAGSFGTALSTTGYQVYADATYGAAIAGYGTTADVTILGRNGNVVFTANDTSGIRLGFYGTSPQGKPTITGSRGANAALASLLTALANLGLLVDSTT